MWLGGGGGECESTTPVAGVTVASDAVTADESAVVADPIVGLVMGTVVLVRSSRTLISSVMSRFEGGDVVRGWGCSSFSVGVLVSLKLYIFILSTNKRN